MTHLGPIAGLGILGTGQAFPRDANPDAPELNNLDVFRFLHGDDLAGIDLEAPARRWGVHRSQWAGIPGTSQRFCTPTDMGLVAARRALANAGLQPGHLDLIVAATATPDRIASTMAARIAAALGSSAGAMDVRGGGAGGLYAWMTAATWRAAGCGNVLVIAADTGAPFVDPTDPSAVFLYADGAAALVLGPGDATLHAWLSASRGQGQAFTIPGTLPPAESHDPASYRFSRPDKTYLASLAESWRDTSARVREHGPVDWFLPYPVTKPQIEAAAEAAGVPMERTVADLAPHGCTGCAGTLVSLHALGARRHAARTALVAVAGGICRAGLVWDER